MLKYTKLGNSITVYIPSHDRDCKVIDSSLRDGVKNHMLYMLTMHFGGCTEAKGVGYWLSDDNTLHNDDIVKLQSFTNHLEAEDTIDFVDTIINYLLDQLNQESVAIEIDGELRLYS
jgi:hypothetical protein